MPITPRQLQLREKHLGSSDMGAIMGYDPYRSGYDVWLVRTGRAPDEPSNEAIVIGDYLEPQILKWAERELGPLVRNQRRVAKNGAPIAANVDALRRTEGRPVEGKTSGIISGRCSPEYGRQGTDQVPRAHWIQCQVHMLCTEQDLCYLVALLGGQGFRIYRIPRSDVAIDRICEVAQRFWDVHIKGDTPPEGEGHYRVLKKRRHTPGSLAPIQPALWQRAYKVWRARLALEKMEEQLEQQLLMQLGDAELGDAGELGTYKVIRVNQTRFDEKRFKDEHPELHAKYMKDSGYNRGRLVPPKKKAKRDAGDRKKTG